MGSTLNFSFIRKLKQDLEIKIEFLIIINHTLNKKRSEKNKSSIYIPTNTMILASLHTSKI